MSLLEQYNQIQSQAIDHYYTLFKQKFLEQVKNKPLQSRYYMESSSYAPMFIKLLKEDGFEAEIVDGDESSYIVITPK